MDIKDISLPNDVSTLQKMLLEQSVLIKSISQQNEQHKETNGKQKNTITCLKLENEKLRFQLNKQLGHRFGSKSEKLDDKQMPLFGEEDPEKIDVESVEAADESITISSYKRKKTGRKPLPEHLPREEVIHDLDDDEKVCGCGHDLHKVGEDVSEQLDIIPAKIKVLKHRRYKYACRSCEEGVKSAQLPKQPIPKSIATAGLLSHVLVSKYVDHLPLYRQEGMLQRLKVDIVRSTMSHWMLRCAKLLAPLVEELKRDIRESSYAQADETRLQVLNEPDRPNKSKSYLWGYRAIGPLIGVVVVFEYQPARHAKYAENFLKSFEGHLQTDGYIGYQGLRDRKSITSYGCMAHARRKFMDIIKANKKASKAPQAVAFIAKLYKVEKRAREEEMSAAKRCELRQKESKPILDDFKRWLDESMQKVPPQSAISQAIRYTLNQWKYLKNYINNGVVEIDNNYLENAIRPIAVGRRNWLFSGSVEGAKASSIIYSLVQTCRANGVEPYAYFKTVLNKISDCKTSEDYRQLLPRSIEQEELLKAYQ